MKILLLCWRDTGHPEGGGSERYLENVAEFLADNGHQVVYRTAAYPGAPKQNIRNNVVFSRGGGNITVYIRAWFAMLAARFGLGKIGRALGGKPDVVVDTQNGVPFFARIFSGAPTVVLTHHCHKEQWPVAGKVKAKVGWFIESWASPRVHRNCEYITVSLPSADDLVALGVSGERITVIRNGISPIPEGLAEQLGAPGKLGVPGKLGEPGSEENIESKASTVSKASPRLVTLSRLVPHKQIEHAIDVVAALEPIFPGIKLDIIGSGWWEAELRHYVSVLELEDHVVFHGQVSEEEKHRILSGASVHLMPSRKEGWGIAVIEAAQHGVPTVGYAASAGLRDSVIDGQTGILATTPHQLAEATRKLLQTPELYQEMSQAARTRSKQFSWEHTGQAVLDLLNDVASGQTH